MGWYLTIDAGEIPFAVIGFPMVWCAFNAMAWGCLISTLVPAANSTLACAVVLMAMNVGLSSPENVPESAYPNVTFMGQMSKLSFYTWTVGVSSLAVLANDTAPTHEWSDVNKVLWFGYKNLLDTPLHSYLVGPCLVLLLMIVLVMFASYLGLRFMY